MNPRKHYEVWATSARDDIGLTFDEVEKMQCLSTRDGVYEMKRAQAIRLANLLYRHSIATVVFEVTEGDYDEATVIHKGS